MNDIDFKTQELIDFLENKKSNEEIERERLEYKKQLLEKGFLPLNDEYSETMSSPMEEVERNTRVYIIEECIPACKELWSKNIFTFMVSDHYNENMCWIEVKAENLSSENLEIFKSLEDVKKFSYHAGCLNFGVECVGEQAQVKLLEIAQKFKMQDVPFGEAYITIEEFLIRCGCYDVIRNSEYVEMINPSLVEITSIDELRDYIQKYDEWSYSEKSKEYLKVLNKSKMIKSLEEYLEETGMILKDERVYLSNYYYQKHLNYLNSLNNDQSNVLKH